MDHHGRDDACRFSVIHPGSREWRDRFRYPAYETNTFLIAAAIADAQPLMPL
jgi:hypothetical protein